MDLAWKPGLVSGLASWAEDDPKPSTMLCALLVPTDEDEVMEDPVCAIEEEPVDPDVAELTNEYANIFDDDLSVCIDYPPLVIPWDGSIPPGAFSAGYRLDPEDEAFIDQELLGWKFYNMVERERRPGIFAAGLFATKPVEMEGPRKRSVVNYRPGINRALIPINYPMPTIQSLLNGTTGARYYSLADMRTGYKQFRVERESQDLLMIKHKSELWRPTRLFEGVTCKQPCRPP